MAIDYSFYKDYHVINDDVAIYKRKDSPKIWQARVKVSAERRYLTKSTRTSDEDEARAIAIESWHEAKVLKKHKDTAKLWVRPFDKVADEFLADATIRHSEGFVKDSALRRAKFGVRIWKMYLGNKLLSHIDDDLIEDFKSWRVKNGEKGKRIANTTISHEYSDYNRIIRFAIKRKYIRTEEAVFGSYKVPQSERGKKSGFNEDEWQLLNDTMMEWMHEDHNSYIKERRRQFRDYMLVLANTGLRVGEARNLKWEDIHYIEDEDGKVYIRLDVNAGKTDERVVTAMPKTKLFFESVKQRGVFIDQNDYVFANKNGKPMANQKNTYDALLKKCGLLVDKRGVKRSITSLRHYYATERLERGDVDVFALSDNMGNSPQQIKNHYSDTNAWRRRKHLTQINEMGKYGEEMKKHREALKEKRAEMSGENRHDEPSFDGVDAKVKDGGE